MAGNLDPREVEKAKQGQKQDFPKGIPECGTDALRFGLCAYTSANRDINLDISRIDGYRKFCNKLWNATKFALMKLGDNYMPKATASTSAQTKTLPEKWILHRLNQAIIDTNAAMEEYNFMNATSAIYKFWLYELCDVYIEVIKPIVDSEDTSAAANALRESVRDTLYTCLDTALRFLHPYMPFVTEELWQRLGRRPNDAMSSIMIAAYPEEVKEWNHPEAEQQFEFCNQVVRTVRGLAADYGIKSGARGMYRCFVFFGLRSRIIVVFVKATSAESFTLLNSSALFISTLCFVKQLELSVLAAADAVPAGCAVIPVGEDCTIHLLVRGMVDIEAEVVKLQEKLAKSNTLLSSLKETMTMSDYEKKIKASVREQNDTKVRLKSLFGCEHCLILSHTQAKTMEAEIEALEKGIANFLKLKE